MGLQGSIDSFPLADVLRLLASTAKSGRLGVDGDRGVGHLWFSSGGLVGGAAAESGPAPGPDRLADVVVALLRQRVGTFAFDADATCPDPFERTDVEAVLELATAALAELESFLVRVPSIEHLLSVRPELPAEEVVIDRRRWTALAAIRGGCSVADLARTLDLDEVAALRTACDLLDLGVVEVAEPAVEDPLDDRSAAERVDTGGAPAAELTDGGPWGVEDPWVPEGGWPGLVDEGGADLVVLGAAAEPLAAEVVVDAEVHPEPRPEVALEVVDEVELPDGLEELFGDFDPFGTVAGAEELAELGDEVTGTGEAEEAQGAGSTGSPILAAVAGEPEAPSAPMAADDPEAELARQLAMLSPKAAQAVAAAAGVGDDGAREHVVRFLGSV